jgi:hypothetical protein
MKKLLLPIVMILVLTACGQASKTAATSSLIAAPVDAIIPAPTPTPTPTPSPTPTPAPSPSPSPVPGVLNCFLGHDAAFNIQVYCTGGNLGFAIAQLENFGWSTTLIQSATINPNANPQPGPPIVCVTETLHDAPHAQNWTTTMCGATYNTVTNVLF